MPNDTTIVESLESNNSLNGLNRGNEEVTQPNIDDVDSAKSGHLDLKEQNNQAVGKGGDEESSAEPTPKIGIRVKRELLEFDGNVGESEDVPEPETEKPDGESNMVEFPTVWPCPTCGFTYLTLQELQAHQPSCRHTLTRPYLCNICDESFERKTDLNNHIVCHQTNRPHACRVCGNLHRTKAELVTHMLSHQVEKPHKCPTCGQEFHRHSSLTNHMKIHTYAAGRALIPPIFSPNKTTPTLSPGISPGGGRRNLSSLQPDRSTEPIPSFETLPVPGYSYYNSLVSSSNYASFLASKMMNNAGPNSKDEETINSLLPPSLDSNSFPSSSATQITCLPDIGQPTDADSHEELATDFQLPEQPFSVDDQNQFDNVQDLESNATDRAFNSFLSVKNAGLLYGIKIEDQYIPDQNAQQSAGSTGSPEQAAPSETQTDDLLPNEEDSGNQKAASSSGKKTTKGNPNDTRSPKPHMCQFCGIYFARLKAYQSHMKLHDDNWEPSYQCQLCGEKFPDYVTLSTHAAKCMRGSRKDEDFSLSKFNVPLIPQAGSTTAKANAVNKQSFKHVCASCDKRFATKQKLFRHMWIHRKKLFTCEACGDIFEERDLLDKHRLEVHPPNDSTPYACTVCGKSFTSRQTLWEHGRVHGGTGSGAALLWCEQCNKSFASRQGYQIHIRTHTGERPYGCQFCMKSFRDGGTLRKHERIHTGERPHVCPLCMRAFNQKVVLREHVRWVHAANAAGEPPLPCVLCNATLPDRESLCAHIVKHSDDMASEARAVAKISTQEARTRRTPKRNSKAAAQANVKFESGRAAAVSTAPVRIATQPSATTTSGDSMDDSSHSTPGSPYFPKLEALPNDLTSTQIDCDSSFYSSTSTGAATPGPVTTRGRRKRHKPSVDNLGGNLPIPTFNEIAPSSVQTLRLDEPAPNVTVADIPDSQYHFMNQDLNLPPTSLDNDMVDPMAYMQVVTDISPGSQDVLNSLNEDKEDDSAKDGTGQ